MISSSTCTLCLKTYYLTFYTQRPAKLHKKYISIYESRIGRYTATSAQRCYYGGMYVTTKLVFMYSLLIQSWLGWDTCEYCTFCCE